MKLFFFLFLLHLTVTAYCADTLLVKDLRWSWLTYENGEIVPFEQTEFNSSEVILLYAPDLSVNQYIEIVTPRPTDIWINDQLKYPKVTDTFYLSSSAINAEDRVVMYSKGGHFDVTTKLIQISGYDKPNDATRILPSSFDANASLIIIAVLLFLIGIYRNYFPNSFRKSFANPLTYKMRSISVDDAYGGFGSLDNVLSVVILGGLISFIFLDDLVVLEWGLRGTLQSLTHWAIGTILIVVAVFTKYFWSKLIGWLFSFKAFSNVQNQDFVHFMIMVFFTASVVKLLDFVMWGRAHEVMLSIIYYLIIISLLFFAFWLTMKFHKYYNHRKLMIISYLCTTEFLPSFVAIYWLSN